MYKLNKQKKINKNKPPFYCKIFLTPPKRLRYV